MSKAETQEKLIAIIEPVCEDADFELVDLSYVMEGHGWVVRVFIDHLHTSDRGVTFEDCERLSRELSAVLDAVDPLTHAYSLEVSSPGVDRPLRKVHHFQQFIGEQAKVRLKSAQDGRKNFQGVLVSANENAIGIEIDGATYHLPPKEVASAKLVPDWDALMAARRR